VSLLHSLFEFLAFSCVSIIPLSLSYLCGCAPRTWVVNRLTTRECRSEISHWRGKSNVSWPPISSGPLSRSQAHAHPPPPPSADVRRQRREHPHECFRATHHPTVPSRPVGRE
jgi:hypothetical protein